jgi:anti-anti-sigma factor
VTPLSIEISQGGRGVVLALEGELDLAGAATLERELDDLGDDGAVVVDLRELDFMDSSGLRALVLAARRIEEASRRFALVPGAERVMRVFEITRMRERLNFVADPAEVMGT